nr:hypothetical protein [Tanacetum cinerariifolium]
MVLLRKSKLIVISRQLISFFKIDSGLAVPVFKQGDGPIDAINKMMSFLSTVVTSRFPSSNNQLRNSSNPRQQATIHDGRVTIQPLQRRQTSFTAGMSGTRANISRMRGNNLAMAILMANLSTYGSYVLFEILVNVFSYNKNCLMNKLSGYKLYTIILTNLLLRLSKLRLLGNFPREPIHLKVVTHESVVTKVYTRRPKVTKINGSNSKPKITKSMISNKTKPDTSRGSNTLVAPSSSSVDFRLSKLSCVNVDRMAPKKTSTSTAPAMNQAAIQQLIDDHVAAALEAQAANMANINNTNKNLEPRETPAA